MGDIQPTFLTDRNRLEQWCPRVLAFLAGMAIPGFCPRYAHCRSDPSQPSHDNASEQRRSTDLGKECISNWHFAPVIDDHPSWLVWLERHVAIRKLVHWVACRVPDPCLALVEPAFAHSQPG